MKKELKTLKDFEYLLGDENKFIFEILKAEAVKWVKEDYELVRNPEAHKMLERWKERFNLTEDDLK